MVGSVAQLLEDDPDFDADEYMAQGPRWMDVLNSRGWERAEDEDAVGFTRNCVYQHALYKINVAKSTRYDNDPVAVHVYRKHHLGYEHLAAYGCSEETVIGVVERIEGILDKMLSLDKTKELLHSVLRESTAQRAVSTLLEDDLDCDEIMFTPSNDHESIKAELEVQGWVIHADGVLMCDFERDAHISFKDCVLRLILMKEPPHITSVEVRAWYVDAVDREYSRLVPQGVDTWQMLADESAEEYVARIEADIRDYVVPEEDAEEGPGDYAPEPDFAPEDFMNDEGWQE